MTNERCANQITIDRIRNVGVISHVDSGKSSTSERILFYTGRTYKIGEVHDGEATTDWMVQEQERGITITAAAITCQWNNYQFNIIDTPGHVDWTYEVERSLRVLDGAVALYDASAGVESQSETVWRQAQRYRVPRIAFANKMDKVGADVDMTVDSMREKLGANACLLQLPIGSETTFRGVIDLPTMEAVYFRGDHGETVVREPIPEDMVAAATAARLHLIETLADVDEEMLHAFLEESDVPAAMLRTAVRRATLTGTFFPVLCGSAYQNIGVQLLMDAIVDYLPSPADIGPVEGTWDDMVVQVAADAQEPLAALLFKLQRDIVSGQMRAYVRLYAGQLSTGMKVLDSVSGTTERIGKIYRMHANKQELLESAVAGDIVVLTGQKTAKTGHTLCLPQRPLLLEEMVFPEPVVRSAIEPSSQADTEKLAKALRILADEDPSFTVRSDEQTGETIIAGMGELHLEVLFDRIVREFNVQARIGRPQVAFRETIQAAANGIVGRIKSQTGGSGQYARVVLNVAPCAEEFVFVNEVKGGAVPQEYIGAVQAGCREAMTNGVVGGYPVTGVKVTLVDGDAHAVDSSEMAFKRAGFLGAQEAMRAAQPVILEPWMEVLVSTPVAFLGDIMGNISQRGGRIVQQQPEHELMLVTFHAPLQQMMGYAMDVRSLSQGRAQYTMQLADYRPVVG